MRGGGGEVMKNLQWGADRTRKKYPANEKFHKKLSVHCSKGVGSLRQGIPNDKADQTQMTNQRILIQHLNYFMET